MIRVGQGFDVHAFAPERTLKLCGVIIPYELGLLGHSDADVATHALMDALLGAAALGDIGKLFPDTDQKYEGADSTALLDLPGIGPYFAGKIVSYRTSLRGYSAPEQLMEIYHFDREKYDGLKDLITCSAPEPYPIWTLSEDELSKHPHISRTEAHSIVIYREHHTPSECTFEGLRKAGTLSEEHAGKLSLCKLQSAAAATP